MASPISRTVALMLSTVLVAATGPSLVPISTFTDYKCNIASTTASNVSVPLDTCITTVGMISFQMHALPCAGGGLTAVANWGFSDAHCHNRFTYFDQGNGCEGAFSNREAFGSLLLTCTDSGFEAPTPQGSPTTIIVGPVVTGAPASSGSATSGAGSDSPSDDTISSCSGWRCLSLAARIGIIVGAAVAGFLIGFWGVCRARRHRRRTHPSPSTPDTFVTSNPYRGICRRCHRRLERQITNKWNDLGNAGRPYFLCDCGDNDREQWFCWDDEVGIKDDNPRCFCGQLSREDIARPRLLPFFSCAIKECVFWRWK